MIGNSRIYVLPSTSAVNAHYSFDEIVAAFRACKAWLEEQKILFAHEFV